MATHFDMFCIYFVQTNQYLAQSIDVEARLPNICIKII
jgi:hypothetical protein